MDSDPPKQSESPTGMSGLTRTAASQVNAGVEPQNLVKYLHEFQLYDIAC